MTITTAEYGKLTGKFLIEADLANIRRDQTYVKLLGIYPDPDNNTMVTAYYVAGKGVFFVDQNVGKLNTPIKRKQYQN